MVDLVKIRKKAKEKSETGDRKPEVKATATELRTPAVAAPEPKPLQPAAEKSKPPKRTSPPEKAEAAPKNPPKTKVEANARPAEPEPKPAVSGGPATDGRAPVPETVKATKLEKFKEQAGRRRDDAESIGRTAAAEAVAAEGRLEVLTFAIAGENYAIEIENIVEIVPPRAATRVPNAAAAIVGIISLRGTIVTLIDVRRRLKHAESAQTPDTRIIVLEHEGETVGFEVDRVFRVVKISAAEVAPHPVVHASEQDDSIRGVFRHGESLTILLDFAKLLGSREVARTGPREAVALASRR